MIIRLLKKHFPTPKHREAFLFGFIYFLSSSVVLTLITKTIGLWMVEMNYSLAYLAFIMSVLHMPNSARILFAAWLDYAPIPEVFGLGYRKSMMFWCKLLSIFGLLGVSFFTPSYHIPFLICAAFTAILSAILESLTSAYFNTVYSKEHKPSWIQAGQIGHQLGILIMNAGALFASIYLPWNVIYASSTIILILSIISLKFSPKCAFCKPDKPKSLVKVYTEPLQSFYIEHKAHLKYLLPFLLFYRTPDQILGPVISFLQLDLFGKSITALIKTISLTAGTVIAGFWWKYFADEDYLRLKRLGVLHSLIMGIIGIAVFMYYQFPSFVLLYSLGILFFALRLARGMESAAIFTYQCNLWDIRFFNSQLAFGNFLDKILGEVFAAQAGLLIGLVGWPFFLIGTAFTNLPSLWGMKHLKRLGITPQGNCMVDEKDSSK